MLRGGVFSLWAKEYFQGNENFICRKKGRAYICGPKNASLAQLVEQLTCNQ